MSHLEVIQKETDSSSCPGCGMDPQDVRRLFKYTAHPTALAHENLCQYDTRTDLSRPGESGITTRMVEKDIPQQLHKISLTFTAMCLCGVCSHVVVLGLSVRLSWYPVWCVRWLL